MVVPVLAVVGVALLVVLMACRRRPSVTLWRGRHFGVRRADLGDGRLGGALHHRLVFAVTAVGWMTQKKNKAQMKNPQIPQINLRLKDKGLKMSKEKQQHQVVSFHTAASFTLSQFPVSYSGLRNPNLDTSSTSFLH